MPEKIPPNSSWNWTPLPKQLRAIDRLSAILGSTESPPSNRLEARNLIFDLRKKVRSMNHEV